VRIADDVGTVVDVVLGDEHHPGDYGGRCG